MWEVWNEHNRFIVKAPDESLEVLGMRAIAFVELPLSETFGCGTRDGESLISLQPLMARCIKLNFVACKIGDLFCGWGFVVRDQHGDVLLPGAKHSNVEAACPTLYGLRRVYEHGFRSIIMEGDSLPLIRSGKIDPRLETQTKQPEFIPELISEM